MLLNQFLEGELIIPENFKEVDERECPENVGVHINYDYDYENEILLKKDDIICRGMINCFVPLSVIFRDDRGELQFSRTLYKYVFVKDVITNEDIYNLVETGEISKFLHNNQTDHVFFEGGHLDNNNNFSMYFGS